VAEAAAALPANRGFVSQLALTLGNPKAIVMFVALLPSLVDLNHLNLIGYGELCACTLVLIPGIEFAYAALAAQARAFLSGCVARKRMNKTAGAIMIGAGIGIVASCAACRRRFAALVNNSLKQSSIAQWNQGVASGAHAGKAARFFTPF
jgi:threonine/homoserine/homoserine lactone efflux protein